MQKQFLTSCLLFTVLFNLTAQDTWQKILGGAFTDESNAILLTSDGNLLIGGSSESFNQSAREAYLAKLTLTGSVIWEKTYDAGSFWNVFYDVLETSDSTYFGTGSTWANMCATRGPLGMECNTAGDTAWLKVFCRPEIKINDVYSVVSGPNQDLVFCGTDVSAQSQNIAVFVTDKLGNVKWTKSMGTSGWEIGNAAIVTKDSNIVAAGYMDHTTTQVDWDCFLVKLSMLNGDTLWTFRIDSQNSWDEFIDLVELADSTLIVVGIKESKIWITHFSANGQLLNDQLFFPNQNASYRPRKIISTMDSGFAVVGRIYDAPTATDNDGFLIKLSSDLTVQWIKLYGGELSDDLMDVVQTPDGGYCMAGTTKSFGDVERDIWVVKTDSLGNTSERILRGKAYLDDNLSCTEDSIEIPFPNVRLQVSDGNETILRLSDATGNYASLPIPGNYTITASVYPPYWDFCNNPQTAVIADNTIEVIRDFAAQSTIECPFISLDVSMPFLRRCEDGIIYGQICNTGSIVAPNTQVRIVLDAFLILDSASVPFTALPDNTYLFDTDSLGLFECKNFKLYINISCTAPPEWIHCISGYAFPDTLCHPDADPAFISARECTINVGSFDPNDKRAFPPGDGAEHWITPDTEIKYQIRFQNTGTDTAFRIVIIDTLSAELDPMHFRTGAFSHPYKLEWDPGNIMKFIFDPIALPDSNANEPLSHGFVNFYLRPLHNLPNGSPIFNSAAIYFDSNTPVITNTYHHTIGHLSSIEVLHLPDETLKAFPNPANNYVFVQSPLEYSEGEIWATDVLGSVRLSGFIRSQQERIDLSSFPNGWYYLAVVKADLPVLHTWIYVHPKP